MRLSTDEERDEERALETIAAAVEAGITVFDTARSYGRGADELGTTSACSLGLSAATSPARIVTKGGMARTGGALGARRARAGRSAPTARRASRRSTGCRSTSTSCTRPTRARRGGRPCARSRGSSTTASSRRVGVSNVNRRSSTRRSSSRRSRPSRSRSARSTTARSAAGWSSAATSSGSRSIAHSPLGGPRRAGRLARHEALAGSRRRTARPPAEVALAWLLALSPVVVAIPGARRPETARSAARAATLELDADERAAPRGRAGRAAARASRRALPHPAQGRGRRS